MIHEPTDYDLSLQAEREVIDKLFNTEYSEETPLTARDSDIRKIARSLFICYFDPDRRYEVFFHEGAQSEIVKEYYDIAERIYDNQNNFEDACKILKFMKSLPVKIGQQIIETFKK